MATPRKDPKDLLKRGVPSTFTPELGHRICKLVATHAMSLKKICAKYPDLPHEMTICEWRWDFPEFGIEYRKAKAAQSELLAEDCNDVSEELMYYKDANGCKRIDAGYVASRKLIVDTRKWFASKLAPKHYGDRASIDNVKDDTESLKNDVKGIIDKLNADSKKEY